MSCCMQLVMQLPYDQQSPMAAVVDYRFRLHAIQLTEKDMAMVRQVWGSDQSVFQQQLCWPGLPSLD